MKKKKKIFFTV